MTALWILLQFLLILYGSAPLHGAEKLRAATGGFGTAINAVVPAAYQERLFQKYGLEGEYIALDSGTLGMQTLLANEIQLLFSTGALAVSSNLQGGDITIIAGGINFFPFKIIARPEVKNPSELKGKNIAVSRFGSASDFAARLGLQKLGIKSSDVTMLQIGGNPARLAAMTSGAVQATVFSEPFATVARKQFGMNAFLDLAESDIPFPENCFMVKRSYLEAHRDDVLNAMKAVIEALYMLRKDKALAIRIIKKYLRVDDQMAGLGYDYYLAKYGENILELPDRKGLEFVIAQAAKKNPKASGQTPESLKLLDPTILQELKSSGFVEKIKR